MDLIDPTSRQAHRAMQSGDFAMAASLWQQQLVAQPDMTCWLNLATARRALGDLEAALAAVDGALRIDPLSFLALLLRASLLERAGRLREAAPAYGDALMQAPPDDQLDPPTRRAVQHARSVNRAHGEELYDFLRDGVDVGTARSAEARRLETFIQVATGRRKRYRQEPVGFFYPGLPAIEFWDREEFPWLPRLEAASDAIKAELAQVLQADRGGFAPYIDYLDKQPLDQWAALNRSPRWGAWHLFETGEAIAAHRELCPVTFEILSDLPQPAIPNRSPAAMFSALAGGTHIPPHTGVSNARLVVHLPLIVPEGCRFRVGAETRAYADGEAWVFDDTIEHEAFNDSDRSRIILLFDVWNPRLSAWEREMIARVSGLLDQFNGTSALNGRGQ